MALALIKSHIPDGTLIRGKRAVGRPRRRSPNIHYQGLPRYTALKPTWFLECCPKSLDCSTTGTVARKGF